MKQQYWPKLQNQHISIGKKTVQILLLCNHRTFTTSESVNGASGAKTRNISAIQHATRRRTSLFLWSKKNSDTRNSASCLYSLALFSSCAISWNAFANSWNHSVTITDYCLRIDKRMHNTGTFSSMNKWKLRKIKIHVAQMHRMQLQCSNNS